MPRVTAKQPTVEQLDVLARDMRYNEMNCLYVKTRQSAGSIATRAEQLADELRAWRKEMS